MNMKKLLKAAVISGIAAVSAQSFATSSATFNHPTVMTTSGSSSAFFVNATNGEYFCEGFGFEQMTSGTIKCGEDESSYANFNWNDKAWEYEDTGSKNQCYPLFASITCSN